MGKDYSGFKKKLKSLFAFNVNKFSNFPCLTVKEIGPARKDTQVLKTVENNSEYLQKQELVINHLIDQNISILDCYINRIKKFNFVFTFNKEKLSQRYKNIKFADLRANMLKLKEAREFSGKVFFKKQLQAGMFLIDCEDFKKLLDV